MSKPISVGDLVMIVRGHECVMQKWGGVPFRVLNILQPRYGGWYCPACNTKSAGGNEPGAVGHWHGGYAGTPVSWLKRLDPDALKDDVPTKEEIPA